MDIDHKVSIDSCHKGVLLFVYHMVHTFKLFSNLYVPNIYCKYNYNLYIWFGWKRGLYQSKLIRIQSYKQTELEDFQ